MLAKIPYHFNPYSFVRQNMSSKLSFLCKKNVMGKSMKNNSPRVKKHPPFFETGPLRIKMLLPLPHC